MLDTVKEVGSVNKEIRMRKLKLLEECRVSTYKDGKEYIIIPGKGPTLLSAFKNAEPKV